MKNKPLTVEELKALKAGDWIWRIFPNRPEFSTYIQKVEFYEDCFSVSTYRGVQYWLKYSEYGTEWIAYKNKEEANDVHNKEEVVKDIDAIDKEMVEAIERTIYLYSSSPTPPDEDLSECIAKDLILHGYGDVKQAIKEALEKLKEKSQIGSFYEQGWVHSDCILISDLDDFIEKL